MPLNITAETPTRTRTIAEIAVQVAAPYATGHVLTEGEAAQLNQVLAENVSNNLRKQLAAGVTEGEGDAAVTRPFTESEAQAIVDAYLTSYEPGVRQAGGGEPRISDPVESEARKMAKEKVAGLLKANNLKQKDVDMTALVDKAFDKNREALMAAATKIVAERKKAATRTGEAFDIEGLL